MSTLRTLLVEDEGDGIDHERLRRLLPLATARSKTRAT